jgi:RNA polymerase sigma-70 factor, ECF subfamily
LKIGRLDLMFRPFLRQQLHSEKDDRLLRKVANGNLDALAFLYERHGDLVYRFAIRLSGDRTTAEEVTQDVFIAVIRQADSFDSTRGQFSTWLCGIARNLIWTRAGLSQRWQPMDSLEDEPHTEAVDDDPVAVLDRAQAVAIVREGLERLPPHFKEVIVLCEFEELSYEQAAGILRIPVGTVRSRLHRAKRQLASELRPTLEKKEEPLSE